MSNTDDSQTTIINIDWPCNSRVPSIRCESKVKHILHRKGEWGRGRDLAQSRLDEIQASCDENGMTLYQALSLRRTMLRSFPNGMQRVNQSQQMGSASGQNQVATIFEEAVTKFISNVVPTAPNGSRIFLTEAEQLAEMRAGTRARGPTPDILFLNSVHINGQAVKWIDAKLYYASATFASHKKLPNGKLSKQAKRYNDYFGGKGAFVFGQSFCVDLRQIVNEALLLDYSPLDMTAVNDFQNAT